jgi:cobalt/nickel transport system permease protein
VVAPGGVEWGYLNGGSPLHRASARAKVLALIAFALIVVATPREWFAVFAVYAGLLAALAARARIPPGFIARKLVFEVPFVVFALLMPIIATGPRTEVAGLSLSIAGLWGAWALLAKATLALVASIVLIATTPPRQVIQAFEQLRLPRALTSIMGFMLRYLDLTVDEARRMRTARVSRGFQATGPASWKVIARGVGTGFVRAHGRGERVHLAMLARGGEDGA